MPANSHIGYQGEPRPEIGLGKKLYYRGMGLKPLPQEFGPRGSREGLEKGLRPLGGWVYLEKLGRPKGH